MERPEELDDAMRRKLLQLPIDARIAVLADGFHGIVDRAELMDVGLHPRAIDRRLAAGRLHNMPPGVYAVGDRALPRLGRLAAAVRATRAVAGRRSAAALHGLHQYEGAPEVIARRGAKKHVGI